MRLSLTSYYAACALFAAVTAIAVPQQLMPDAPQPPAERRASPLLRLFPPIEAADLIRWRDVLVLSDAQALALDRIFVDYQEQIAGLQTEIERLSDIARGLGRLERTEMWRARQRLRDEAASIRRAMAAYEDALLLALAQFLTKEQRKDLVRVELERQRVRYAVRLESLPGAAIDLVDLVNSLELDDEEVVAVRPILDQYEVLLTPLLTRRFEAAIAYSQRGTQQQLEWLTAGRAHDEDFIAERRRLFRERVQLDTRLRAINHATLAALAAVLSQANARRLTDLADAAALPSHYPDPGVAEARAVLDALLDRETIDAEQREALDSLERMFELQYDRLRRWLDEEVLRFEGEFQRTGALNADDADAHDETIAEIRRQRRELAERTIEHARSLAGGAPDQDLDDE